MQTQPNATSCFAQDVCSEACLSTVFHKVDWQVHTQLQIKKALLFSNDKADGVPAMYIGIQLLYLDLAFLCYCYHYIYIRTLFQDNMLESLLTHIFWSESFIHCSWTQDLMTVPFLLLYLTMCLCVKLLMNTFCSRQNVYIHTRWIQRLLVTSTSSILNLHEQEPKQSWQTDTWNLLSHWRINTTRSSSFNPSECR